LNILTNLKKSKEKNLNEFYLLEKEYDNELFNINQSRDDIFNIYMHGYEKSKTIIFDNFIALK
jgi:hypothetical protein